MDVMQAGRQALCWGGLEQDRRYAVEWDSFLARYQLVDVTPHDLPTYIQGGNTSSLDKWLVRDTAVLQGAVITKVHALSLIHI